MDKLKLLFLGLFIVLSIWHLIDSFNDDARKRKRTKPFLVLCLLLYYLCAAEKIDWLLAASVLCCWLGDVLLIPHGDKWFVAGGLVFLLGHIFFIIVYSKDIDFSTIPLVLSVLMAAVYYGISLLIIRKIKPTTPKAMVAPMYLYLLCNSTMNLFAMIRLYQLRSTGALIAFIGAILFFISDCTLFLVRYYKEKNIIYRKHFTVMLTYLAGVLLIILGMLKG